MSISDILAFKDTIAPATPTRAPATPTRHSSSPAGTPKNINASPSVRRRFCFDGEEQPDNSSAVEPQLKRTKGSMPRVTNDAVSSILEHVPFTPISPTEFPNGSQDAIFSLHRGSMNHLGGRRTRLGELVPKLGMDFETGQKFLQWQNKRFTLTPISTNDIARQHQVWRGKTTESGVPAEVVMKTYHHIVNPTTRESLIKGDRIGYDIWQQFLKDHACPEIRLPKIYSKIEEGILVMEDVKVDQDKLAFWKEWEKGSSLEGLSSDAMKILTLARDVMELMWKNKIDLGDFRAENTIWKDGRLYIIDWQYIPESEKDDFVRHLKHYIQDWAKGNQAVYDFLSKPVPELMKANTASFL